jgi:kinesin family protein 13
LLGSKHLFRIVCPKADGDPDEAPDWDFAQRELAAGGKSDADYEREKQLALDEQRRLFETQLQTQFQAGFGSNNGQPQVDLTPVEKRRLEELIVRACQMQREATDLCQEMNVPISFRAVLRLSEAVLADPALLGLPAREISITMSHDLQKLRRHKSVEVFQNFLTQMRAAYAARQAGQPVHPPYIFSGSHELIGVANVYLDCLQHGIQAELEAGIVNQDGRLSGSLRLLLLTEPALEGVPRDHGSPEGTKDAAPGKDPRRSLLAAATSSGSSSSVGGAAAHFGARSRSGSQSQLAALGGVTSPGGGMGARPLREGDRLRLVLRLVEAVDLPVSLAHQVHVRSSSPPSADHPENVLPNDEVDHSAGTCRMGFPLDSERLFSLPVTEGLLDDLQRRPVAFHVYGHTSHDDQQEPFVMQSVPGENPVREREQLRQVEHTALAQRWRKHTTHLLATVTVLETNDNGVFAPVFALVKADAAGNHVCRLREGASRRLLVEVKHANGAKVNITGIRRVMVGDVCVLDRGKLGAHPIDSYRDDDLALVKRRFEEILQARKDHLEENVRLLMAKPNLSKAEAEQKKRLQFYCTTLTREKDAMFQVRAARRFVVAACVCA